MSNRAGYAARRFSIGHSVNSVLPGFGGGYLTASMAEKLALMPTKGSSDPLRDLSGRELEVLDLLGDGKTLAEIADRPNIGCRTSASLSTRFESLLRLYRIEFLDG